MDTAQMAGNPGNPIQLTVERGRGGKGAGNA